MQKKERMANLEVLRCVAMMMVVVLHYLGKGDRKSTRLNSSHNNQSRMPSSA